jgi:hypothetical protein
MANFKIQKNMNNKVHTTRIQDPKNSKPRALSVASRAYFMKYMITF